MSSATHTRSSQPPRVQNRPSFTADERRVRRLGSLIFAELLPQTTSHLATVRSTRRPWSSLSDLKGLQPDGVATHPSTPARAPYPHKPAMQAGKEPLTMKAYRTESRYYFSSKHLLPAGSLVFFSDRLQRYVHPTDGFLLDVHPYLLPLSDAESRQLEEHWRDALSSY